MGVLQDKDKYMEWRYIIKNILFTYSDNKAVINPIPTERVKQMGIENNYDDYYFPLFKITLALSENEIHNVIKNRKTICLHLELVGNCREKGAKAWSDKVTKYLDTTFDIILGKSDEDMLNALNEEKSKKNLKKKKDKEKELISDQFMDIDLYLYKPVVGGMKKNINKIFTGVNIADVITYIMGQGGVKKLYFAQPTNTEKYKQLLIPPMSLMRALEFIDMYYGIYKFGSVIWFDFDKTYVKPYNAECTVWDKKEKTVTNIIIPKGPNSKIGNFSGVLKRKKDDKKNNYLVGDYTTLGIVDQAIVNNYVSANDIETIKSDGSGTKKSNSKASSKKENYVQMIEDTTENKWVAETYAMQALSESQLISIDIANLDLKTISVNKKFNLIFEDSKYTKKYNGAYIVSTATHSFVKADKDVFHPVTRLILKRMK